MRQPKSGYYYPPRARWYSRFIYLGQALVRKLPLERLRLPGGFNFRQLLIALALPGFVFFVLGRKRIGQVVLGSYVVLLLAALIWFGSGGANLAFGLMVALHALSWSSLLECWLELSGWGRRLLLALFSAFCVATLVYWPAQQFVQTRLVTPLRIQDRILLVAPAREYSLTSGQTAIFRVNAQVAAGVQIREGFTVAEILAKAGDRIKFRGGFFQVNDSPRRPSLPYMPGEGEWLVPKDHWFIWPLSSMGIRGDLNQANPIVVQAVLRELAFVPANQVVGRPLHWWFWRNLYVP